jgi:hypothetical protein
MTRPVVAAISADLHTMGVFGPGAPATLRELRTGGQRTPAELIDRYQLACRPVRDLLVEYLQERQPALDYSSLDALDHMLGRLFWADLERSASARPESTGATPSSWSRPSLTRPLYPPDAASQAAAVKGRRAGPL